MIQNFYWKLQQHLFVLIRNDPFKHCYIFLYITIFIWEVWFTCFPKWFEIIIDIKYLKVLQFGLFIQICQHVSLSLKLDNVTRIFWLIYLVFETWSDHYSLVKFFVFLGACLPEIETKLFSKTAWVLIADILLKMSNLNWSVSYCLKLWYIDFFGSNFSKFVLNISSDDDHSNQVQRNLSS